MKISAYIFLYFQTTMPMLDQTFQIPVSLLTPSSVGTISRKQINNFSSLSVMNLMSQYQERTTVSSTSLSSTSSSSSFQWFADKVRGWGRRYSNPNTANVCFTCSQVIQQVALGNISTKVWIIFGHFSGNFRSILSWEKLATCSKYCITLIVTSIYTSDTCDLPNKNILVSKYA